MMPACLLLLHGDNSELWSSAKIAAKMRMPRTMLASLVPSVCFELILIGMLVVRAYSIYRDAMRRESMCAGLASVLSRDSITYFVVILAVYVVNSMIWTFASPQYFQLGVGFGIVLPCVLGSRLLLNLRATDRRESLVMSLVHAERLECLDIPPTP
ncbi:hypothetical protein BD410DRAFT_306564 [Rickenella mellea]|uniref:Uncharacterized protein n=1 Tax=Rickenella mellea TaxID=50990 RepID=A0A4Y7PFX3_9AGAM|nr:hypothetical protein BD410DRAFT_306564 [Rickenella mellea]